MIATGSAWSEVDSKPPPESAYPNVVLISIDTLSARMLGCYGYQRPTSPAIDALAKEGVVFESAYATSPWTLPSHASLLTGLYPNRHGLKSHDFSLPPGIVTWAQLFKTRGFRTAAVVNSHNVGKRYGLDRGFEHFGFVEMDIARSEPTEVEQRAHAWLDSNTHRPFFLFLHFYDVHSDYTSLPEYEEKFVAPYDGIVDGSTKQLLSFWEGELPLQTRDISHLIDLYVAGIRQMDEGIARIVKHLKQLGMIDETLVIIVSDHGEEFLEHGSVLHGRTQFDEVMRVPLIIRGPGIPAGKRIAEPVSLVDLLPSVASHLGLLLPEPVNGIDVFPLWSDSPPEAVRNRFLFGGADHNNEHEDMTYSVRHERFKLIYNRVTMEHQLFDLESDRAETVDVGEQYPRMTAELLRRVERQLKNVVLGPSLPRMEQEEREKLEALGYLSTDGS